MAVFSYFISSPGIDYDGSIHYLFYEYIDFIPVPPLVPILLILTLWMQSRLIIVRKGHILVYSACNFNKNIVLGESVFSPFNFTEFYGFGLLWFSFYVLNMFLFLFNSGLFVKYNWFCTRAITTRNQLYWNLPQIYEEYIKN